MSISAPASPPCPPAVISLTFISDCRIAADERYDTIVALVRKASRANAINDITGALLLSGEQFVHTLEGPAAAVDALMGRIAVDPRHAGIVIVDRRPVVSRAFAQWALAYWGTSVFVGRLTIGAKRGDEDDVTRLLRLIREFGTEQLPPRVP